jgi:hypothetical protein
MTIHIIYRHTDNLAACGVGKSRPKWFSFEGCLNNILSTIEDTDFVKFHLMYDGELKGEVDKRIDHVEIVNEKSAMGNWVKAWDYAKSLDLKDGDLIYHLENDYMHAYGWAYKIRELYDMYTELDYVTLYDHPHFYHPNDYPNLSTNILPTYSHHWITRPSTTGAFIVDKRILFEDYDTWVEGQGDYHKFIWLGKNKKRNVISPIPSLSTHCETEWLATTVDWEKLSK